MPRPPVFRRAAARCVCALAACVLAACTHDSAAVKRTDPSKVVAERRRPPANNEELRSAGFTLADDLDSLPARTAPSPDYASIEAASGTVAVIQRSHEKDIVDIKTSPDGRLIVSASKDRTVRIWSAQGVLLRITPLPGLDINCLAISPDGAHIAVGAKNALVRLGIDGRILQSFTGAEFDTKAAAFGRGGVLITTPGYRTVIVRDADWKTRAAVEAHDGFVRCVAAGPAADYFVTCGDRAVSKDGWDACARMWSLSGGHIADIETNKPGRLGERRDAPKPMHRAAWADISPDGSMIALLGERGLLRIRARTGEILGEAETSGVPQSCIFAPDGRGVIVRGAHEFHKYGIGGEKSGFLKPPPHAEHWYMSCAAVSADGRYLVAGFGGSGLGGAVRIWDTAGALRRDLRPMACEARRVLLSPDATRLYLELERGKRTVLWNLRGRYLEELPESVGFDGAGREYRFRIDRWGNFHLKYGTREREIKGGMGGFQTVLPSGELALSGAGGAFEVYDENGAPVRRVNYPVHGSGGTAPFHEAAFDAQMKYFVLETMRNHGGVHRVTLFGMDGRQGNTIDVEDALGDGAVCANGELIATGHVNGGVRIFDRSGKRLKHYAGHLLAVNGLAITADKSFLLSTAKDRTTRLWNLNRDTSITLVALKNGEWIAYDDAGRFECSDGARDLLHFVKGLTPFDTRQLWDALHAPGMIADFLKGVSEGRASVAKTVRSAPSVSIRAKKYSAAEGTAVVSVCARPGNSGVGRIFIIHNGRAIDETARGMRVEARGACREFTLVLEPGENAIRGAAHDSEAVVFGQSDELSLPYFPPRAEKPDMYVLAVGVSTYRDANINLRYPAEDARAVAAAFRDIAAPLYGNVRIKVMVNEGATRSAVMSALGEISREAKKSDAVVVFLAGHGDTESDVYYYLPHDADISDLKSSCLSHGDIGAFARGLAANKVVLLLDTCKSGAATKGLHAASLARGLADHRIMARVAREHGIAVFSAAGLSQEAYEIKELRHGIFTYCLLEALGARGSEIAEGGIISVARLLARVSRSTRDTAATHLQLEQTPIVYMFGDDFSIGKATKK